MDFPFHGPRASFNRRNGTASWCDGGDAATGKATGKLFIDAAINTVYISVVGASLACFNVF